MESNRRKVVYLMEDEMTEARARFMRAEGFRVRREVDGWIVEWYHDDDDKFYKWFN